MKKFFSIYLLKFIFGDFWLLITTRTHLTSLTSFSLEFLGVILLVSKVLYVAISFVFIFKIFTNKILLTSFSLLTILALMSNSSGRGNIFGQAVTGAPGDSNRTCASSGCHSSGAFSPTGNLTITDEDGNAVEAFIPGAIYDVTLSVEATGNANAFGFQMVALTKDENGTNSWTDY